MGGRRKLRDGGGGAGGRGMGELRAGVGGSRGAAGRGEDERPGWERIAAMWKGGD